MMFDMLVNELNEDPPQCENVIRSVLAIFDDARYKSNEDLPQREKLKNTGEKEDLPPKTN